ncbi:MAG: GWxTD domain-containing protein [Bacteroidales bacterium]|nr:GWxTD domain-containing protein [Bacteroidales bacterium]
MKRIFYIFIILLISSACFNLNSISLYNLSSQYSNTPFTELQTTVFNIDDSTARLWVLIFMDDMIADYDTSSGKSYTRVQLKYELFDTYESKQILDSVNLVISDSSLKTGDTLIHIDFKYPDRNRYILKLSLTDLNRIDFVDSYLCLDNTSDYSRNSFLLKDQDGSLLFRKVISADEEVNLQLADKKVRKVFVRYYKRDFPLALPPFMEESEASFNYKADSTFTVTAYDGKMAGIRLPRQGFYHFQTDSNQRNGFTIYRFHKDFPEITNTVQMLEPLRYITTRKEYTKIDTSEDKKLAIDNFWLDNAGNPSRARAMIQKYYGRVVDANDFFTSYLEGWKTDRGLIYIVYGPPKIVYRGKNLEEWLYGEKGNSNSIRFQFVKVINPFTDNDYSLIKSPSYKEKWYNIVNTWRR